MFRSKLWSVRRCEAEVQTDMAEGILEQGQGSSTQTGMVAELHEQVCKLEASLASERRNYCLVC